MAIHARNGRLYDAGRALRNGADINFQYRADLSWSFRKYAPEARGEEGDTVLQMALKAKDTLVTRWLLNFRELDLEQKNALGKDSYATAAEYGMSSLLPESPTMVAESKDEVESLTSEGNTGEITTLIHLSSEISYIEQAKLLIAVRNSSVEGVKTALKNGANVNFKYRPDLARWWKKEDAVPEEGDTALHIALKLNEKDIVSTLLGNDKRDPHIVNARGKRADDVAREYEREEMMPSGMLLIWKERFSKNLMMGTASVPCLL